MIAKTLKKNTSLERGARYFHFPPLQKSHLIQLRIGKLKAGSVGKHVKVFLSIICMSQIHNHMQEHMHSCTGGKQLSFDCSNYQWQHLGSSPQSQVSDSPWSHMAWKGEDGAWACLSCDRAFLWAVAGSCLASTMVRAIAGGWQGL